MADSNNVDTTAAEQSRRLRGRSEDNTSKLMGHRTSETISSTGIVVAKDGSYFRPQKAYRNMEFLTCSEAKPIRIMCEYFETERRLRNEGVRNTILFFGSARARSRKQHAAEVDRFQRIHDEATTDEEKETANIALERLQRGAWMCDYYDKVKNLSQRLTEWSIARTPNDEHPRYIISTGGGPGMMAAANEGARAVEGGKTIGMGVSLPFETGLNMNVTQDLAFEFHYFFTRKFWMVYTALGVVVAPGGTGTMDELFEVLTLLQTKKIDHQQMPVVLLGADYWNKVINLEVMYEHGVISQADINRLYITDSVDDAFEYITTRLQEMEAAEDTEAPINK